MIKPRLRLILLFLLSTLSTLQAQDFLNAHPLSFSELEIQSASKIENKTRSNVIVVDASKITVLKQAVTKYNDNLYNLINQEKIKRQAMANTLHKIMQQRNTTEIKNQIIKAQKDYKEMHSDIIKNLEKAQECKGLYVFVKKDIPAMPNQTQLINEAEKKITPIAIEQLRGIYIQSVTELYSSDQFDSQLYQHIKETISGTFEIETKYKHAVDYQQRVFYYVAKVRVNPLKKNLVQYEMSPDAGKLPSNIAIINYMKDKSQTESILQKMGVSNHLITQIKGYARQNTFNVSNDNQARKQRQKQIIYEGQKQLDELSSQITQLKRELRESQFSLKQIIEQNTTVKFNTENLNATLRAAEDQLKQAILNSEKYELVLHEKILKAEWDRPVAPTDDAVKQVAADAFNIKNQLENNYGEIELFIETHNLVNGDYTEKQGQKKEYKQKISRFWLFPEAIVTGYKLHTIAQFKIIGETSVSDDDKMQKEKDEEVIVLEGPCSGPEYLSNEDYYRCTGMGESADMIYSKKIAKNQARDRLKQIIKTTIPIILQKYVKARKWEVEEVVNEASEQLLNNSRVICNKLKRTRKNTFQTYITIEMSAKDLNKVVRDIRTLRTFEIDIINFKTSDESDRK
ncbi:hypothetical protein [Marinifilum flexuosum]|uniref:Outer membrane efflux protein n=1 Tax=Marinifilum flexuosum TaxID=1117708 RepID=A0A419X8X0_9BACT|nr:hypothetical protein [Marinifilum flexuosum]RKE04181.1 hypothetical protein BXY64_1197 [Marinifilum flexuosum]